MTGKNKSYGYEGGYEDWTADKVYKNMRIIHNGKQATDVKETEDIENFKGEDNG